MRTTYSVHEARAKLSEFGATLRADDFNGSVLLVTRDSMQFYDGAIAKRYGEWILIWTEHHDQFVQHQDEIRAFRFVENGKRIGDLDEVLP